MKHMRYQDTQKQVARERLNYAVRRGQVIRPLACESCSAISSEVLQGHHEDYSRPLDVIWLCGSCHRKLHFREIQARAKKEISLARSKAKSALAFGQYLQRRQREA